MMFYYLNWAGRVLIHGKQSLEDVGYNGSLCLAGKFWPGIDTLGAVILQERGKQKTSNLWPAVTGS